MPDFYVFELPPYTKLKEALLIWQFQYGHPLTMYSLHGIQESPRG